MSKPKTSNAASNAASTEQNQQTLVTLYDVDDISPHHCGYCNQNGNISIGMPYFNTANEPFFFSFD